MHKYFRTLIETAAVAALGVAVMVEHVLDLGSSYPWEREGRDCVFGEEVYGGGFDAEVWRTAGEGADKENFVGVEGIRRMVVEIVVVDGGELFYFGFVAGFFVDFT